jgi:hypothetical protein
MNETQAKYLGRIIDKRHFRAFVHAADGNKKLVESWNEFERHMATGVWFDKKVEALEVKLEPEIERIASEEAIAKVPKKRATRKSKEIVSEIDTVTLTELLSLPSEEK